jgi:Mg-chelatase subunit ChlD
MPEPGAAIGVGAIGEFDAGGAVPSATSLDYLNAHASAAAGCSDQDRFPDSNRGARSTGNRSARRTSKVRFLALLIAAVHYHSRSSDTKRERLRRERASKKTPQLRTSLRPRR